MCDPILVTLLKMRPHYSTNINYKGMQRTADEYARERWIYKDLISKNDVDPIIVNPVVKMRPHRVAHPHYPLTRYICKNMKGGLGLNPITNKTVIHLTS